MGGAASATRDSTPKIVAIDCYCGAGGLTRGLRDAGIDVVKGIDCDPSAKATYEKNNPGSVFMEADMRHVSAGDAMEGVERRGRRLLLAGCAPCQPFSKQNANAGRDDERASLIGCFGVLVSGLRPDYVMVENVPGFQKSNEHQAEFVRMIRGLGYFFDDGVLNAADYGVPQTRSRYLLVASRYGPIRLPEKTHGTPERGHATVRDAISKLPPVAAGGVSPEEKNHTSSGLSETNKRRIRRIPHDGGGRGGLPPDLALRCHDGHDGHTDVYGRMWWDRPAPTLTCRCTSLSNGRFGHPEQDRAISVREAALLQTFPKNYVFHSSHTANTRHVGNAVPVLFAKHIGGAIMESERSASRTLPAFPQSPCEAA